MHTHKHIVQSVHLQWLGDAFSGLLLVASKASCIPMGDTTGDTPSTNSAGDEGCEANSGGVRNSSKKHILYS